MPVDMALDAWTSLVRLAGDQAKIHITGGEPYLYFDHLAALLQAARRCNLPPLDCLETNGSWADSESEIRQKIRFLQEAGLRQLSIGFDPFHAEFVPVENIRTLRALAGEILGPRQVRVRWEKYLDNPLPFEAFTGQAQKDLCRQMLKEDRCRFTGRAAEQIAPLIADKPLDRLASLSCQTAILGARGVHIDPCGHVFSGQCSGIILANLQKTPLDTLWKDFDPQNPPFWRILFNSGPFGLLEEARKAGYQSRPFYASKCHLCSEIRRFFFDKGIFLSIIGPSACYGL